MSIFKKKETLAQNMAFMGIMIAINVVFVVITSFVPLLFLLLIFILPFTNTIVTLLCKKKWLIIYAVALVGVCMLVTLTDFTVTLFYVVPSLFSGIIFGLCYQKKISSVWSILICSLIGLGLTFAFIPLIDLIYGQNVINVFAEMFKLKDFKYLQLVIPVFIFIINLIQSTITEAIISSQLPKFGFENNNSLNINYLGLAGFFVVIIDIFSIFFFSQISLLLLCITLYLSIAILIEFIIEKDIKFSIISGSFLIIGIITFLSTYSVIKEPFQIQMIGIFAIATFICAIIKYYLFTDDKFVK